jgi:hypothetical protein
VLASEQRCLLFCQCFQAKLDITAAEFSKFLELAAPPGLCTVETCTDVQAVVFLHYLPKHVGHWCSLVAPFTLNGTVSSLSRAPTAHNRTSHWEDLPGGGERGNPAGSQLVDDFQGVVCQGGSAHPCLSGLTTGCQSGLQRAHELQRLQVLVCFGQHPVCQYMFEVPLQPPCLLVKLFAITGE